MAMNTRRMETCSPACYAGLGADRAAGAIYGPYGLLTDQPGKFRFVNSLEFAGHTSACTYCGDDLPRGRAVRILRKLHHDRLTPAAR